MAKFTRESFHVYQAHAKNALKQSQQVTSVLICAGTGCIAGGSLGIYDYLKEECARRGLDVRLGLMHDGEELHIVDGDDVGVVQRSGDAGFSDKKFVIRRGTVLEIGHHSHGDTVPFRDQTF